MNDPTFRSVLAALVALGVIALAGDQLLALGLASRASSGDVALHDGASLTQQLENAASAPGRSILLLGDSVLAGDVLAAHSRDWRSQRVLDYLRSERNAADDASFHQVALDALLPIDVERILVELERIDPENHVALVIELNLRIFSPHYRDVTSCTRDWICAFPNLSGETTRSALSWRRFVDAIRNATPVWRHRQRFEGSAVVPTLDAVIAEERAGGDLRPQDELLARARIEEHYRVDASAASQQLDALDRIVQRLEETGRQALFFATPLRDGFADSVHRPSELATLYAGLATRIHDAGTRSTRFVSFDHPLFGEFHFVDHVHLTPLGARLLALNLLAELGVRIALPPSSSQLVYDYGIDRTLLHGGDLGYLDGPSWSALSRGSGGISFDPEAGRLVIAARFDHTLRVMRAGLRSVEWLAGARGERGGADGPAKTARFNHPESPVALAGSIYLIDGNGVRVRELRAGQVSTPYRGLKPRLRMLTTDGRTLYGLDASGAVWRLESGQRTAILSSSGAQDRPTSLAISGAGQLFVADARRIWRGSLPGPGETRSLGDLDEVIQDTGLPNLPARGSRFPLDFDSVGFSNIVALRFVEQYKGLLVVDEVDLARGDLKFDASERTHLRMLDFDHELVFPWLRPVATGKAYFPKIRNSRHRGSYFHESDIALDPETVDLYLLERTRSRLIRIGDGIFGTAQASHHEGSGKSAFGVRSQRETLAKLRPHDFRAARVRREGLRGHLLGLFVGNSTLVMADAYGFYSLVQSLERELAASLELVEHLEVDLFGVTLPQAGVTGLVRNAELFMRLHFVPDFVLIDVNELLPLGILAIKDGRALEALSELARVAQSSDFDLVIVDGSGLGAVARDGLRPRSPAFRKLFGQLREAGFAIIEPTSDLLVELMDVAPWGNPPYRGGKHHGSPPAIDSTARAIAAKLAPRLVASFERRGQRTERVPLVVDAGRRGGLRAAVHQAGIAEFKGLAVVPAPAAQVQINGTRLEVLIDVGKLEKFGVEISASRDGVASVIKTFVVNDLRGSLVDSMRVRFVRFSNYDEYGQGTQDGATTLHQDEVTRESLGRFRVE